MSETRVELSESFSWVKHVREWDEVLLETPRLSYTGQEKTLPIHGFSSEGYLVYPDKINGHFLWDVPEAHMCNPNCPYMDDTDVDDELEVMRKKKKKKPSHPKTSCNSFPPQSPDANPTMKLSIPHLICSFNFPRKF